MVYGRQLITESQPLEEPGTESQLDSVASAAFRV